MRDITPAQIAANNEGAQRTLSEQGIETDELYPLSVQKHAGTGKWQVLDLRDHKKYVSLHETYEEAASAALKIKQGEQAWQK